MRMETREDPQLLLYDNRPGQLRSVGAFEQEVSGITDRRMAEGWQMLGADDLEFDPLTCAQGQPGSESTKQDCVYLGTPWTRVGVCGYSAPQT